MLTGLKKAMNSWQSQTVLHRAKYPQCLSHDEVVGVAQARLEKRYPPSSRKIGSDVYWLSIPDTKSKLFENVWPVPEGINYNAYLIGGERNGYS